MKSKRDKLLRISEDDHKEVESTRLRVSFDFVDWDTADLFFLHGLELDHYKKIFNCIDKLGQSTEADILQQTHESLIPKPIFRNEKGIRSSFPEGLVDKIKAKFGAELANNGDPDENAKKVAATAFEVRVHGKGYGRIHGFVWNKSFHVIWFDPAHNLYPRTGEKPKTHREYATVPGFSPACVEVVRDENRKLHDDHDALRGEFEAVCKERDELYEQFANAGAAVASNLALSAAGQAPSF
ncbi:hypothetical protein GmRootV213_05670 [Variovorax sp. V213]|uniref:hypothetical protein n=1 Tax=Variovorax sp. V213 TaxID=3065955 RepID=UPI0034E87896